MMVIKLKVLGSGNGMFCIGMLWGLLLVCSFCYGQKEAVDYPVIGSPVPEFTLSGIEHYKVKEVHCGELMGKHVLLWFWHRYCPGSYRHFDEMDALREKYKDSLEIFMIGGVNEKVDVVPEQEEDSMRAIFERAREFKDLKLPAVYDMGLYRQFRAKYAPTVVWIDGSGIVKAVTSKVKESWVERFIDNEPFVSGDISYDGLLKAANDPNAYNYRVPFLVDGNGGESSGFEYRSLLTPFTDSMPAGSVLPTGLKGYRFQGKLEGTASLVDLYKMAYLGHVYNLAGTYTDSIYNQVVLEVKDTLPFRDYSYDVPRKNVFWYSLIVPKSLSEASMLKAVMQKDLMLYFGYTATVEKRVLPYWSVKLSDGKKEELKSKGGTSKILGDWHTMMGAQNVTVGRYLASIFHMVSPALGHILPIQDETGMEGSIDVPLMDVDLENFEEVRRVFREQGFMIEKAEKEFWILVISDSDNG